MPRRELLVTGVVQGVGFRPHVYRLATELGIRGSVANTAVGVVIEAEAPDELLVEFARRVWEQAPRLAQVRTLTQRDLPDPGDGQAAEGFRIIASTVVDGERALVPADTAVCEDCLRELRDPADRRYRHPFITCTACGPRFTIIRSLPYDRPGTTMADFPMCERCAAEYTNPADRRFHAQPVACNDCGPELWTLDAAGVRRTGNEQAIAAAQRVLAAGGVVAVKGIGGYHLACSATNRDAVALLRSRKHRPAKPLAVMAADLATARRIVHLSEHEAEVLSGPARPILLARRVAGSAVVDGVAPGTAELGVMLAYSPLHHLLLTAAPAGTASSSPAPPVEPLLVMTSGNLSDEPICYRDEDVARLLPMVDLVLGHTRPIHLPCDDSVVRVVDGKEYPLRRSRGYAPTPVPLGRELPPTFAVGAELKNTVCVIRGSDAFSSQHLGDMAGWESQQALAEVAGHVMALYEVTPQQWACDMHPGYQTAAWAQRMTASTPLLRVQHHLAHAVSLLAEHGRLDTAALVACFDGTGYGTDGGIWGGEWLTLTGDPATPEHTATLAPIQLPGGDAAVRQPWRTAMAHLHAAGIGWDPVLAPVEHAGPGDTALLLAQLDRRVACVPCTSAGRLFDAVSSLLGICHEISYEAQAAIELEQVAATAAVGAPVAWRGWGPVADAPIGTGWVAPGEGAVVGTSAVAGATVGTTAGPTVSPRVVDPAPMLAAMVRGLTDGAPVAQLALGFHVWLARAVVGVALAERQRTGIGTVGLTGGVFANVLLLRACAAALQAEGFEVLRHHLLPCNDGGIAVGQAVVAAVRSLQERD